MPWPGRRPPGDSAKLKALDAVAKKHKVDGDGKDLLASLAQERSRQPG